MPEIDDPADRRTPRYRKLEVTRQASECQLAEELHTASPERFEGVLVSPTQVQAGLNVSSWPEEAAACLFAQLIPMCWRKCTRSKDHQRQWIKV